MERRAIGYLRTSSAANVEGDSAYRQNDAIMAFARRDGLVVDSCFWDAAVSGTDPIETRAGFVALLEHAAASHIDVVVVEDASRFARSVLAQELGLLLLARLGIRLITASGKDLTDKTDAGRVAMRQMDGVFSEYEKTKLVQKLRHGREKLRATGVKVEGRKSHAELSPELVKIAKRLYRRSPATGRRRSLRGVAAELVILGYTTKGGGPLSADTVRALLMTKAVAK